MVQPLINKTMCQRDRDTKFGRDLPQLHPIKTMHFKRHSRSIRKFSHCVENNSQIIAVLDDFVLAGTILGDLFKVGCIGNLRPLKQRTP